MPIEKLLQKNFDLTSFTTLRIRGQAEFFIIINNKQELVKAIAWAKAKKLPLVILAGGSNIVIVRKKIKGLVLKISGERYIINKNYLICWAGTGLTKLSKISALAGLTGLEWSFGMPGSIGGAVRGNAGAYGFDMSNLVAEVEAYDLIKKRFVKLKKQACNFSYRNSIFKKRKNLLIVGVKLKLAKGVSKEIKALSQKNFDHRFRANPKEPSAGCVFKNLEYKKVIKQNKRLAEDLAAKGLVRGGKIGAAYLIDQLGLKGKTAGQAKVSEKHANFIINIGKAKSKDVIKLINLIKRKIKHKYKIN
ncbi:UDP-N-acetylmuramate dehydrogenase, partial [Patescibacteria group bacterium]|nr:UDP-N-acetylmuramate dehydrogenase [Patescibacteria group bacterium]